MKQRQSKTIKIGAHCADLLVRDIRETNKKWCDSYPALEAVLRNVIGEAVKINNRLGQLESCNQEYQTLQQLRS